jgi:hypothetical protein
MVVVEIDTPSTTNATKTNSFCHQQPNMMRSLDLKKKTRNRQ